MTINLKELKVIPALMALVFAMYNSLTFTALEMQSASYMSLGIMLLTSCLTAVFIVHQRGISRFALCVLMLLLWVAAVTMLNGNDLNNWVYQSASLTALLFLFVYYREDIRIEAVVDKNGLWCTQQPSATDPTRRAAQDAPAI